MKIPDSLKRSLRFIYKIVDNVLMILFSLLVMLALNVSVASCSGGAHEYAKELRRVDKLNARNPAEASRQLSKLENRRVEFGNADRWYMRLLRMKVDDRLQIRQTDVKEAKQVMRHFKRHGDEGMMAQSMYCMGCAYRDIGDSPAALEYFQKADDANGGHDTKLSGDISYQIGSLMAGQSFYRPSLPYLRDALRYGKSAKDTTLMARALQKMAYAYQELGNDSCLLCLDEAEHLARSKQELHDGVAASKATYYFKQGECHKSAALLAPLAARMKEGSSEANYIYAILARSYYKMGDRDSALLCFQKLYKANTLEARGMSCKYMARIYREKGQTDKSLKSMVEYEACDDSMQERNAELSMARMNSLYNYQKYRERNLKLETRGKIGTIVLAVSLVAVVAVVVFIIVRVRKWRRLQRARLMRLRGFRASVKERSEASQRSSEQKIRRLENQLADAKGLYDAAARQLETLKEQVECADNKLSVEQQREDDARASFMASDIYRRIERRLTDERPLSKDEQDMLEDEVNSLQPSFKPNLYAIYPVSRQDFLMCVLIKLSDISASNISVLLGRSRSAISKAKAKLQVKFLGRSCEPGEFDAFLRSL